MRTLIVSSSDPLSDAVHKVLLDDGQDAIVVGLDRVDDSLKQFRPELVVVVLAPDPDMALRRLGEMRVMTQASILAVGAASDSKLVLRALRTGADDFLDEADPAEELRSALARLRAQVQAPNEVGITIGVLSPSGGGGASTLAVNLAVLLTTGGPRVLLVDLKPLGGDPAALLNLKPVYTLSNLCQNVSRMDRIMLERALAWHDSGVRVLSGPRSLAEAQQLHAEAVHQVLVLARVLFPYTLLDLDHSYLAEQLRALRDADLILIVFRPEFTSLRHVRQALDILQEQGVSRERFVLVANRCGQPKELPRAQLEEALGMPIPFSLPDDPRTMNQANNTGVPAVVESPTAKVCKSLAELASRCRQAAGNRAAATAPVTNRRA